MEFHRLVVAAARHATVVFSRHRTTLLPTGSCLVFVFAVAGPSAERPYGCFDKDRAAI